jgi:V/A-type H+-transporting ATPase subunit D
MPKVKLTKTELKAQTDALKRFQRFLPMLQLKKQQLQAEIAAIGVKIDEVSARESAARAELAGWVKLFSAPSVPLEGLVTLNGVETATSNIAGVTVPVFKRLDIAFAELDLAETPAWLDDAAEMLARVISFQAKRTVLEKERELIAAELNTTAQRVNLFEKIRIPECKENIRVIKIAIGDEQTASVTRGKIAKGRSVRDGGGEGEAA